MFTDVKQYREALGLLDDPELDVDLKHELADQVRYFEHDYPDAAKRAAVEASGDENAIDEQRMLGGVAQSSRVESSREGIKRGGAFVPRSREQYGQQYRQVAKHRDELDPETAEVMQSGLESAYDLTPEIVPTAQEPDPAVRQQVIDEFNAERVASRGEGEPTLEQSARRAAEEAYHDDLVASGLAGIDERLPNASKRSDLNAPPEYLPRGASFTELLQTQPWLEPPLDVVKQLFKQQGHNVEGMTEQDPRYRRFADAAWKAEYTKAKAEGRPVVRLDYMSSGDWKRQAYKAQAIALNEVAGPLAYGIDKSLTAGLVTEAMSGMMGEDARKAAHRVTDRSPVVKGAGQVIGAFAPGGLAAKVYGATARTMAPAVGSGLGQRVLGMTAAAGATAGAESVAGDLIGNAGEAVFADSPHYKSLEDIASRAATSTAVAMPFGAGSELLGSLAGAGVKALREGRRGKAIADLEQAGMTTGGLRTVGQAGRFDAFGRNDPLKKAQSRAALEQRDVEDVLADPVVRGMSNAELAGKGGGTLTSGRGGDLRGEVLNFRKRPGQEANDLDLLERAQHAGVADELLLLPALRGMRELENATPQPGLSLGSGLYSYIPNAIGSIGTRLDPLMRALSRRESAPAAGHSLGAADISEDLLNFIRNIAGKGMSMGSKRAPVVTPEALPMPVNPLRDIAEGRPGRFSARQFGAGAGGADTARRDRHTISDLTWEEQQVLKHLIEAMQRAGQLPAASGE